MIYINLMQGMGVRNLWFWGILALAGCGGGGGGSGGSSSQNNSVPAGTITEFVVTGVTIRGPKHMAFLPTGSDLYVANQTRNEVLRIDSNGQGSVYAALTQPFGLAFHGSNATDPNTSLYSSATFNGTLGVGLAAQGNSNPDVTVNAYGLAFTATKAYIGKNQPAGELLIKTMPGFGNDTSIALGGTPVGAVYDGNDHIYVSLQGAPEAIKRYKISTNTLSAALNLGGVNLSLPNALSMDGSGNLYVVNKGDINGDGGTVVKISDPSGNSPTASILVGTGKGLCGSAGLAYRDGYLYVSNGTCTEVNGKRDAILKIKT